MKNLAILLLSTFSLCASAQNRTKTSTYKTDDTKQSVSDDGKTLHIMIRSSKAGKEVKYDHTFLVSGMSEKQKDALVKRVNDSLGINPPPCATGTTWALAFAISSQQLAKLILVI